jgi:hypothetical protein
MEEGEFPRNFLMKPPNQDDRYLLGGIADYQGQDMVAESEGNVVAVSVQYRLGVFGKLTHFLCYARS